MKDYIFIIGPSAVGKTTLAKGLFKHYDSVYIEQNMVPEFGFKDIKTDDIGLFEEKVCCDNTLMQIDYFHKLGYKNIIALDFDDLRTREIPIVFKGTNFITLKLISRDYKQIERQMEYRHQNEGGLYVPNEVEYHNNKILSRSLLPNEVLIDVNGKTREDVLKEAINIIDNYSSKLNYDYELPDKNLFESWVKSNNLE